MPVGTQILVGVLVVSLGAVFYAYALYPALLFLLSSLMTETNVHWDELPEVTLVIAAYNEQEVIADKIENSLKLEYPEEKLDIVVFSDASSDWTDEIVQSYADEGVQLMRFEGRIGKTACQNRVAEAVDTDVLVFSDANSMYDPHAIRALVGKFDADVGCVVGRMRFPNPGTNVGGFPIYRRYEQFIQRVESLVGSVVKGNGAIYAVRASCYVPLPPDAQSDFAEPLAIRARGYRIQFAPDATGWEDTRPDVSAEIPVVNRIATRSWHTVWAMRDLLNPLRYGRYSVQLWSRTVLLWLSPLFLTVAFVASIALVALNAPWIYSIPAALWLLYIVALVVGIVLDRRNISSPIVIQSSHYFAVLNYGLLVGLWNFVRGENIVTWDTDERTH